MIGWELLSSYYVDILSSGFIIGWIVYTIMAVIYLNFLSKKYLNPKSKDSIIGNKELKSDEQLIAECQDKDTINVLVLGGGGVRGLIPLYILSYIEKMTGKKVGELFNFFAGSSTGSISVGGFAVGDENGGYKFSAQDIFDAYENNAHKIFTAPWYHQWLTMFGLFAPRYTPDGKMHVLESYFNNLTLGELKGNLLIPVYNLETQNLEIVKSWKTSKNNLQPNYLVKDLINGASSPPMMFPPMAFSVNSKTNMFIDPAVLINNPILHVLLYVKSVFPEKKINLVLIGNGSTASLKYNYKNLFSFGLYGLYQYLFNAPALSSKLYIEFIEEYVQNVQNIDRRVNFFRINSIPDVDLSVSSISRKNFMKIKKFAQRMLSENMATVNKIINLL